jgi:transposase
MRFEARIKELVENLPDLAVLVEPLLVVRRVLREQIEILHRRLLTIVRDDEVCRRLMTVPGVGPVVALTYRATVDVPARFRKSKSVGAVFGLTCSKYQSGEIDRSGRISRRGDEMMRVMLYEAAQVMLTRTNKWSWLKAWAMKIARHRGMKKAIVALARRLAVILHRIWVTAPSSDGPENQPRQQHDDRTGSHPIGGNSSSTERWNDVPRGTMDEVSSP